MNPYDIFFCGIKMKQVLDDSGKVVEIIHCQFCFVTFGIYPW